MAETADLSAREIAFWIAVLVEYAREQRAADAKKQKGGNRHPPNLREHPRAAIELDWRSKFRLS